MEYPSVFPPTTTEDNQQRKHGCNEKYYVSNNAQIYRVVRKAYLKRATKYRATKARKSSSPAQVDTNLLPRFSSKTLDDLRQFGFTGLDLRFVLFYGRSKASLFGL